MLYGLRYYRVVQVAIHFRLHMLRHIKIKQHKHETQCIKKLFYDSCAALSSIPAVLSHKPTPLKMDVSIPDIDRGWIF